MTLPRAAIGFIFSAAVGLVPALAQQYVISTYAGVPAPPGANMPLFVRSLATDAAGNVYFSSYANNPCTCVFRLDAQGNLTRVAGSAEAGFSGDGGPAIQAQLSDPVGLAVDSAGNLFIAEGVFYDLYNPTITPLGGFHERVRKVSPNGIITTVAGGGDPGFSGDGGPATSASFMGLNSIAVDAAGNLFIGDGLYGDAWDAPFGNNRIRKVTPDGIINTVAGTGDQGFSGDGGPAVNAQLNGPGALTADSAGNVFFSDFYNLRIRKLSTDGTITIVFDLDSQVPECSTKPNYYPSCSVYNETLDPSGNLVFAYSSDAFSNAVFKQSPDGTITTVVGVGAAQEIGLTGQIAADGAGNLWFSALTSLRKISPDGTVTVVLGSGACCGGGDGGPATSAQLRDANSVAVDGAGNLFIADTDDHRIRDVMPGGIITTVAGNGAWGINCDTAAGDSARAIDAQLCLPSQVAADGAGDLFIVDRNRIRKVSPDGTITSIAGDGTAGTGRGDGGPATQAQLAYPNSVSVDSAGNVYFAEYARVRKITPDGIITTVAGTGTPPNTNGCSPTPSPACGPPPVGDGWPATSVQLIDPTGVTVDSAGNLYFVEGRLVCKVSPDGILTTVAGNPTAMMPYTGIGDGGPATGALLWDPNAVTVDSAGNLYISEQVRIRKVTTDGIMNTIAGTGSPGYSGDGGPATNAQLWNPTGLTVDAAGNVYFADSLNNVIRVLRPVQ
ncbi:MAG TPA: hypothetical protein VN841_00390 [Bryobacteraceae bacterium]|nr:hypothetical protein [Bryobacteraceae bacterium]